MEFIYYFIQRLVKIYLNILQENILEDVINNLI